MKIKHNTSEKIKLFLLLYHFKSCGIQAKGDKIDSIRFFYEDRNFDKFFDTTIFINNSKFFHIRKYEKAMYININ